MARRLAALALVVAGIVGLLVATGIVRLRVQLEPSEWASASPFWREEQEPAALPQQLGIWVELARVVRPAVVNVSTTQRAPRQGPEDFFRRFFGEPAPGERGRQSLGSGFIVSSDGYIGTNFHVVKGASEIVVRLPDHSEHRARLVGGDAKTDIALLKIDASGLPTLAFGDSDRLQVGEPVMAVGNPFGLEQTVTTGIVSAKERFIGAGPYDDFIQTDASINPGNSGGPLVDARGALIGINAAIFSQSGGSVGIGFAVPVNIAKDVLPQLREGGKVVRGYLGVAVGPVPPDLRERLKLVPEQGAAVAEVVPRSPAAQAGLAPGDVITAFQNAPIQSPNELTRRVGGTPPGTQVSLRVARPGGERTVQVALGQLRDEPASEDR
ncbi:MAG TPA: trypsin-like peptidase domain-containing protein [Methylomirabilota bacterium]|nr:trypsin-like peptidase domain-containing protein [Methylomirabilota bacterium]